MAAIAQSFRGGTHFSKVGLNFLFAHKPVQCLPLIQCLHTSQSCKVDRRKDKAIVRHLRYIDHEKTLKHRYGPLIDLPDYSYVDGRPTEMALQQRLRQQKNYELAKQVVQLVEEIKFAQDIQRSQKEEEIRRIQQRQESRLKEKDTLQ